MTADLRAGVIGLGFGANHARILSSMPGVKLVAVADSAAERLSAYEGTGVHTYTSCAEMVALEKLDAAIIAVPARLHAEVAIAALEAGCAVLVEKPLAPSHEEAVGIVKAAKRSGRLLMPGHIERFNPAVIELAKRIRGGEIGRLYQVTARRMSATRAGAHGSRLPPTDVNVIHDSALHDIDVARYILSLEVASVFGVSQSGIVTPAEDSISAVLMFDAPASGGEPPHGTPARGPVASLEVNWLAPRRVRDLTVMGERGMFLLDYAAQSLQRVEPGGRVLEIPVTRGDQLEAEIGAFVAALREGSPSTVTASDGLAAVAVADALTRSARSGQPVLLSAVTA